MPFKCVLCSDVRLEHHYRHMTTKKHQEYGLDLISNWNKFLGDISKQKSQCLFIVGNLFATPKPRNDTLVTIGKSMNDLAREGIHTFILPGPNDTPLTYVGDKPPHFIFETIANTTILYDSEISPVISKPFFAEKVGEKVVEIYAPSSPLLNPETFDLQFRGNPGNLTIFCLYAEYTKETDLQQFRDRTARINPSFLKSLQKCDIDVLVLGGPQPAANEMPKLNYKVIIAPQLSPIDFAFSEIPTGYCIVDLANQKLQNKVYPISTRKIIRKEFNVSDVPVDKINERILNLIKDTSDPHNFFQIRLFGNLSRDNYHHIVLHNFREKGNRLNFYFELVDEISFLSATQDIVGFDPMREVGKMVELEIQNQKQSETPEGQANLKLLEAALKKIQTDWTRLSTNENEEDGDSA